MENDENKNSQKSTRKIQIQKNPKNKNSQKSTAAVLETGNKILI